MTVRTTRNEFQGGAAATVPGASITSGATSFTVVSATSWPTGGANGNFVVVIGRGTATEEKILCSSRSGVTFTVATSGRGYDGTSAVAHTTAETVEHCIDANTFDTHETHMFDTTRDDHTQYLKKDGSQALTGVATVAAIPGSSAVGDTAAKGTGPTLALSDHRHGREAFATPAIVLGTAAAAGAATTPIRSDSTIVAFDATAPTSSAVGDAAAVGTAVVAARRDHKHGREAATATALAVIAGWYSLALGATAGPVILGRHPSTNGSFPWVATHGGTIKGVDIVGSSGRTAGTLTVEVYKNGVSTGVTAVLDATHIQWWYGLGSVAFAVGDLLDVRYTTVGYSGATVCMADITVALS